MILIMRKHFVRVLGYPPGSHMYGLRFNRDSLSSPMKGLFPGLDVLVCLDPHGSIIQPIESVIPTEVMRPGNSGLWNENEVTHYYVEGTVYRQPLSFSKGTPRIAQKRHTNELISWYTGDRYTSYECHGVIDTPNQGSVEYARSYDYAANRSDGRGINHTIESQTALSWHCTYWTDGKGNYPNCVVTGSGEVYASNGSLRYRATANLSGKLNWKLDGGSYSIDIPLFCMIDLGEIGESKWPSIPSAPAYFQGMYDVPETLGTDIFDRLTVPTVNNIENLKDFKPKEALPPIRELLQKHNIKSVADFYLWYHYSLSPTIGDIKTYVDFFRQLGKGISDRKNLQTINIAYKYTRYKIVIDTYWAGIIEALGLTPNLGNTWDCLPFSFVLDWFVKVGDVLASIDANEVVSQLRVHQVTTSYKRGGPMIIPELLGNLSYSFYERRLSSTIPQSVVRLHAGSPSKHLLDAGSLYLSGRKR